MDLGETSGTYISMVEIYCLHVFCFFHRCQYNSIYEYMIAYEIYIKKLDISLGLSFVM